MATIKKFEGNNIPNLKKGELATDGSVILMKNDKGQIRRFVNSARIKQLIHEEVTEQLASLNEA